WAHAEDDRGSPGGAVHDRVSLRLRELGLRPARDLPHMAATDRAEQSGDDLGEPGPGAYARRPRHREHEPTVLRCPIAVDPALAVGRLDGGVAGLLLRDGHPRLPTDLDPPGTARRR